MDVIFSAVMPLFAVIFIGFFAGRAGMMDPHAVRTLIGFVFHLAMPALLFRMMAAADIGMIGEWAVPGAYLTAQIPMFIGGMLVGGVILRQS